MVTVKSLIPLVSSTGITVCAAAATGASWIGGGAEGECRGLRRRCGGDVGDEATERGRDPAEGGPKPAGAQIEHRHPEEGDRGDKPELGDDRQPTVALDRPGDGGARGA